MEAKLFYTQEASRRLPGKRGLRELVSTFIKTHLQTPARCGMILHRRANQSRPA
jgi:hypothetical protein